VTRDVPWINFLLLALSPSAFVRRPARRGLRPFRLLIAEKNRRANSKHPQAWPSSTFFCLSIFYFPRQLPASRTIAQGRPEGARFRLARHARQYRLTGCPSHHADCCIAAPPKGVLLVFYRGYWWTVLQLRVTGVIEERLCRSLKNWGVRPVAISVDSPSEVARPLPQKPGTPLLFSPTPSTEVIRRYGPAATKEQGVNGHDIAPPRRVS